MRFGTSRVRGERALARSPACHPFSAWPAALLLLLPATPASAQAVSAPPADARSYRPADFANLAPRNAFEMLSQIPGFAIDAGDTDRRGLGQASANVVINGRRFAGKSADIATELARIGIGDVVRIDIVDGNRLGIAGLTGPVANVVTAAHGLQGNFTWRPEYRPVAGRVRPFNGDISLSGAALGFDYRMSLVNTSTIFGSTGPELVTGPHSETLDRRRERANGHVETPQLRASLHRSFAGGAILNLNGLAGLYVYDWREISLRSGTGQPDRERITQERQHGWNGELGGDYEFGLGGGRLKLIVLRRDDHEPFFQTVTQAYADGRTDVGSRFVQQSNQSETVARTEYRRHMAGGDWQLSAEVALNRLDIDNRVLTLDPSGRFVPDPFAAASAVVEERRAEFGASYARPLGSALTLQASLGGEYSRLSQAGAGGLTRTFTRPKGFVSLGWTARASLNFGLRVERTVGQLNFADFVASADVNQGTANAGNVNLVPPQSWNLELRGTGNFGRWGSATLRLYANFVTDIVDIVPIGATGQAPGNLDHATRYGLQWTGTLALDPLGWSGARFDLDFQAQTSALTDPLTGRRRSISQDMIRQITAGFRRDLPRSPWSYGSSFVLFRSALGYRLDLVTIPESVTRFGLFVENRNIFGCTVRVTVDNVLGYTNRFARYFYDGRRTGTLSFVEDRRRHLGPMLGLSISGRF